LGEDPTGDRFRAISERMLTGRYYPPDAVEFFGEFQDRDGRLRVGDRVLQRAPFFPFTTALSAWSMVEIWLAEQTENRCQVGYVTTAHHHGRGIWQACLERRDDKLTVTVKGIAAPQSLLFWLGLPVARYLQKRAWRRAIESFKAAS
jgi:hypothetical protein